jgi:hypothetical protein
VGWWARDESVTTLPAPRAVAELLRLPAVLTVPGDSLLGAAAAGTRREAPHTVGLALSSSLLYLAGMALNDYADREVDALERPHRPIPSGMVEPRFALRLAQALTAAGIVMARLAGGSRALRVAGPLAGAVWSYDLVLKGTPAGPPAMATCRSLDVLLGAGTLRPALVPAALVGGHTLAVTAVSRHETTGGAPRTARVAAVAAAGVTLAAAGFAARRLAGRHTGSVVPVTAALVAYATSFGGAAVAAAREPTPERLQRTVGAGVLGLIPLESALVAGARRPGSAAVLASLWPIARRLAKKRSVT